MSKRDPKTPNRRDVLVGLSAGVAATAATAVARGAKAAPAPGGPPDLDAAADLVADAITDAWNAWLAEAEYDAGEINSLVLEGGALSSPVEVDLLIEDALLAAGARGAGVAALAGAAAGAWEDWAADWSLPASDAFPTFAAVAAPEAAATEAEAVALQPDSSGSFDKISTGLHPILAQAVLEKGPAFGGLPWAGLVQAVAWRVGQRVAGWSAEAMVEGIRGGGPVPTFAPPYVPVGPVVMGSNLNTPGQVLVITPISKDPYDGPVKTA